MRNKGRPLPAEDLNFIRGSSGSSAKNDNYLQNGQKSYKDRATYGQRNKDDGILMDVSGLKSSELKWFAMHKMDASWNLVSKWRMANFGGP